MALPSPDFGNILKETGPITAAGIQLLWNGITQLAQSLGPINQLGVWTPVDTSGAGLTLTVGSASWARVGNLIAFQAVITYPSTASGANTEIGGLPVPVAFNSPVTVLMTGFSSGIIGWLQQQEAVTQITLWNNALATPAQVTNATMSGHGFHISGAYIASR